MPTQPELLLRGDGVEEFNYGDDPATVIAGINAVLGVIVSDQTSEYPTSNGAGFFHNADSTTVYGAPFGRHVCWLIGFCVNFSGNDATTLVFSGWRFEGNGVGTIRTETGLTIHSLVAEHPELVNPITPCFNGGGYFGLTWIGVGSTLIVLTIGTPQTPFTESSVPPMSELSVKYLAAGHNPYPVYWYCG